MAKLTTELNQPNMADKSDAALLRPEIVELTDWQSITNALHEFPPPTLTLDQYGELGKNAWLFRGVGNAEFDLAPTIERDAAGTALEWPELEIDVSEDFKSRANLYLTPPGEGELGWLALMQHYGVPTRRCRCSLVCGLWIQTRSRVVPCGL